MNLSSVLHTYGMDEATVTIKPLDSGLINHSWKVSVGEEDYLLQRVNHFVFKDPGAIAENIRRISRYLAHTHPEYYFIKVVSAPDGRDLVHLPELGYFRIFSFVKGSHSIDVVQTPEQAFEAAVQFGRFTRNLSGFDAQQLHATIPHFHDLGLRYRQFDTALAQGNKQRMKKAAALVAQLNEMQYLVARYEHICQNPEFRLRVMHHDTKISNVLFDDADKGICVIDLDTVMPGYFISDVGDMMRTYLSPVSEEEKDWGKIEVRTPFYEAIVSGYMQEMQDELSAAEQQAFFYAGQFMIYMQALRFITDYLNDDVYYGERYPDHNLMRATNQTVLLQQLMRQEEKLTSLPATKKRA